MYLANSTPMKRATLIIRTTVAARRHPREAQTLASLISRLHSVALVMGTVRGAIEEYNEWSSAAETPEAEKPSRWASKRSKLRTLSRRLHPNACRTVPPAGSASSESYDHQSRVRDGTKAALTSMYNSVASYWPGQSSVAPKTIPSRKSRWRSLQRAPGTNGGLFKE